MLIHEGYSDDGLRPVGILTGPTHVLSIVGPVAAEHIPQAHKTRTCSFFNPGGPVIVFLAPRLSAE